MNKNNNASGIFGIVITIFLLIILVIFSNVNIEKFSYIEGAISKIVTPIQNGMIYLKNKINGNKKIYIITPELFYWYSKSKERKWKFKSKN